MSIAYNKFIEWFRTNVEHMISTSSKVLDFGYMSGSFVFGINDIFNVSILVVKNGCEYFDDKASQIICIIHASNIDLWTNWLNEHIVKHNIQTITGLETAYFYTRFFRNFSLPPTVTNISINGSNFQNIRSMDFPDYDYSHITELRLDYESANRSAGILNRRFPNLVKLTIECILVFNKELMNALDNSSLQMVKFTGAHSYMPQYLDKYVWEVSPEIVKGCVKSMTINRKFDYLKPC
jgi:hypothetical protein